jgi:Fe-S-cluster-containing dehydrogenase component
MGRRSVVARYGMIIDVTRCNGCYNCQIACKDEHAGHDFQPYTKAQPLSGHFWMRIEERERGQYPRVLMSYVPIPCLHCQVEAPCMSVDTRGAIYRRSDGIVLIDPDKSEGRRDLVESCPFDVIFWNENESVPQKCTFCAHLLDSGWKEPRCVEACPTQALLFGDLDDPESPVAVKRKEAETEVLWNRNDVNPHAVYMGLPKPFLAGTVALGDVDECARGAHVVLSDGVENTRFERETDGFGDFQFDGLIPGRSYALSVTAEGYLSYTATLDLERDTTLKEIVLKRGP